VGCCEKKELYDMDNLEFRKVKALEDICDRLARIQQVLERIEQEVGI
jgi:hypothetical protein